MAHTNSLVFAGIAPHPPIMVPEVGRESCVDVEASISAMAELTTRVIDLGAETVVLISPHAPLQPMAFVAYDGPTLRGDFSMFRGAEAAVEAELDDELLTEITRAAEQHDLITLRIRDVDLDHGTAVPLYFLQRNGWSGKVVALGYSFLSNQDHLRFGNCIRQAIATVKRPVAFIASGDLSHRLQPGAPAGFDPNAHFFDEEVVAAIRGCTPGRIVNIDQKLRQTAGECGYRSLLVALGVAEDSEPSCEVLSYEAPFGVGYLVAQLMSKPSPSVRGQGEGAESTAGGPQLLSEPPASADAPPSSAQRTTENSPALQRWDQPTQNSSQPAKRAKDENEDPADAAGTKVIPALARRTIETFVREDRIIAPPNDLPDELTQRAACFVSIKTLAGDLRGCIGTVDPAKDTLAEEIIANAVAAATRDPRFPPVRAAELSNLKYSVDVLSAPEACTLDDLDPKIYGVIVEDESGFRRGLLLPALEGITTAAVQVDIAASKAGIPANARVKLFRFRADRYSE